VLQNDGDDFTAGSQKLMRLILRASLPLAIILPLHSAFAMDFDSPDESPFPGPAYDTDESKMPDLEMDQAELRTSRLNALGVGLGEVVYGSVLSLVTSRNIDEQHAVEMTIGIGSRRTSDQAEGGTSFSNKIQTTLVDGRYLWWPSRGFPFSLDAGLTLARVRGSLTDGSGSSGSYQAYTVGIGGGLGFENVFENGVWFKWAILSGRYVRLINGHYNDMTGERMSSVRDDLGGLKLVGIANLTCGYSW